MLKKISTFLPAAFERIDRRNILQNKKTEKKLEDIIKNLTHFEMREDMCVVRGKTLVINAASPVLKQRIYTLKERILSSINKEYDYLAIEDIMFKG